jgi:hypothetical protein
VTPTATPTPSNPEQSLTGPQRLAGTIRYFSAPTRLVPGVAITAQNSIGALQATTDAAGQYEFPSLATAHWRVVPSSEQQAAGVTTSDAVTVLRVLVGEINPTQDQWLACDANGNGGLSAGDASAILQYQVGLIPDLPAVTACGSRWVFVPDVAAPVSGENLVLPTLQPSCTRGAIEFSPLSQPLTGRDFRAILLGDCNGSWEPPSAFSQRVARAQANDQGHVRFGRPLRDGSLVRVPVYVWRDQAAVQGFTLRLHYDRARWRFVRVRYESSSGLTVAAANGMIPGELRVAAARTSPGFSPDRPAVVLEWRARRGARPASLRAQVVSLSVD